MAMTAQPKALIAKGRYWQAAQEIHYLLQVGIQAISTIKEMCRWFLVFLMAVLPLQLSWAAAAMYCQHEDMPTASHFGHHAHTHHAPRNDKGTHADKKNLLAVDEDCGICHLGDTSSLPSMKAQHVLSALPPRVALDDTLRESHIPALPERPDRHWA